MTDSSYLIELPSCDSTNDELRARSSLLQQHGMALFTLNQRQGRGRLGKSWISPLGNLALSICLHAPDRASASLTPLIAGLVVYKVLSLFAENLTLKWPNDILRNGKKVCGILCETVEGILYPPALVVIVGIGVNLKAVNTADFAAAALWDDQAPITAAELAEKISTSLRTTRLTPPPLSAEFINQWNQAASVPTEFFYGSHQQKYTALSLQPDGSLQAIRAGKLVFLNQGEILLTYGQKFF